MLTDCLGREIKVDDLICATVKKSTCFGRVVRMTRTTIQFMVLYDPNNIRVDKNGPRGHYGFTANHSRNHSRWALQGDILRCVDSKNCMIVNGVYGVDQLIADGEAIFKADLQGK